LIPSHKDTPEEQNNFFPQLLNLTTDQRKQLIQKFWKTDDPSFFQYLKNLSTTKF